MTTAAEQATGALDGRNSFGAYMCDSASVAAFEALAREQGWKAGSVHRGGIAGAIRALQSGRSPQFLAVDLSESGDPRADINALADVCEPGTLVLTVGMLNDVVLYRDLLASGIHDYLLKPLDQVALRDSVALAQAALAGPAPDASAQAAPDSCRLIVFTGTRGGAGSSMIASATAWMLAEDYGLRTTLLDLDVKFGTAAMIFDLEPGRGLIDALDNPTRVDSLFVDRAVLKVTDTLGLLGAEAPLGDPVTLESASLTPLLDELRGRNDVIVLDLPHDALTNVPIMLADASDIVVVTELTLAATRDAIRLISFLTDSAPDATLRLVANKTSGAAANEVSRKDFEASVERRIDCMAPLDAKAAVMAAKQGQSIAQSTPNGKLVSAIRPLARALAGPAAAEPAVSFWSKLFRRTS